MSQVVSANRLSDGLVVYLCNKGAGASWSLDLADATVAETDEQAAELLALGVADAQARHEAVDPYLIQVAEEGGRLRPTKYRELIRCLGPTVRSDLGKQSEAPEA
jgi:hypothetical protein